MTTPTALDVLIDFADAIGDGICLMDKPKLKTTASLALTELARLRADSRELAAMKAGGVWLKRCKLPLTDKSLRIAFWNGKEDRYVLNVFGEWWTLEKPHEGRDDGE